MNQDLLRMSRKYGSDPDLVLAGGGNTSYKKDNILWIKASGHALATIDQDGFVAIDRPRLQTMWKKTYDADSSKRESQVLADLMNSRIPGETGRPSVETALHDLIDYAFVLHLHPSLVNGVTCSVNGKAWVQSVLGESVLWMDATKPGYILAKTAKEQLGKYSKRFGFAPHILLLENHGVFFGADTVSEIDRLVEGLLGTIQAHTQILPNLQVSIPPSGWETVQKTLSNLSPEKCVVYHNDPMIAHLLKDPNHLCNMDLSFTPDHLVYCHRSPLWSEWDTLTQNFADYVKQNGYSPRVVLIPGWGLFGLGSTEKQALISQDVYLDAMKIAVYSQNFGGPQRMKEEDIDFILNWEVEHYRAKATANANG